MLKNKDKIVMCKCNECNDPQCPRRAWYLPDETGNTWYRDGIIYPTFIYGML